MRNALLVLAVLLVLPQTVLAQNQPPVADAGGDVDLIYGEFTQLQGSGTDPDDDPIVSFLWNIEIRPQLSRAALSDERAPDPLLVPDVVGDYVISLVVADGMDSSLPDTVVVRVAENLPPTAVAVADPTTGPLPLTVQFDGSQSSDPEGAQITFLWDFGDASPRSTEVAPSYLYTHPGTYFVTLTVSDSFSLSPSDPIEITVLPPANMIPTASPIAVPNTGTPSLPVQFTANASDSNNDLLTYAWDFDDPTSANNTSNLADPVHVYTAGGTYTVSLTVDDGQDSFSTSLVVTVEPRFDTVFFSPDIDSTSFGGTTVNDEDVAVDLLDDGPAVLVDVGPFNTNDVTAFHVLPNDDVLLSFEFDGPTALPGGLVVEPADVVRYDGNSYSLEFRPSVDPVLAVLITDAVSVETNGDLLLSFDGPVTLNSGGLTQPEDLVLFDGSDLISYFDGSAAGVPSGLNLDASHSFVVDDHLGLSFDGPGTMNAVSGSAVSFEDEDVLEFRFDPDSGTWELLGLIYDGSAAYAGWVGANLDALFTMLDDDAESDADGDGVLDVADLCAGTAPNTRVDLDGCSRSQFCESVDATTRAGAQFCRSSDWLDDEPGKRNPGDCRVKKPSRSQTPLCIPTSRGARRRVVR